MAQFKCKMCGGLIETDGAKSICECDFCGTSQTVPQTRDNSKLQTLHNRANTLRLKNEFDSAILTYESIINENPADAEAHWGLVISKYGIEYVDDPQTLKKIPTCHRAQNKSIFDDIDYKAAIENSDVVARKIYQNEAEEIDNIQKGILAISINEKPYDIFICYKETDDSGKRTRDSFLSEQIYEELTKKEYKVFFSRITLESKLGLQYEPYIFSALNTSKVMLIVGTKPEYFNAVWLKNEWSRFLSLMNIGKENKYIIPCYRDMDAYELPYELLPFQAQDMNKLGFIQDLLRGIDKIFGKDQMSVKERVQIEDINTSNANILALLKRAEILIEDEDNERAFKIIEEVLNNDPENAKAYILSLLIELHLREEKELASLFTPLTEYKNYNRALKYADNTYKFILKEYNEKVLENIKKNEEKKRAEKIIQDNETTYQKAILLFQAKEYDNAINVLKTVINYKDSKELIEIIVNKSKDDILSNGIDEYNKRNYYEAIKIFESLNGYKDSEERISAVKKKISNIYKMAVDNISHYKYRVAKELLSSIINYEDSKELIDYCVKYDKINDIYERSVYLLNYSDSIFSIIKAINNLENYLEYRDTREIIEKLKIKKSNLEARQKRNNKIALIMLASITTIGILVLLLNIKNMALASQYDFVLSSDGTSYEITEVKTMKENIVIPSTYCNKPVERIGNYAFDNCTTIKKVEISNGIKVIGYNAFRNCSSLTSIIIPNSVLSIGQYAFYGCSSLTSITIPFIGGSKSLNNYFAYIFGAASYNDNAYGVPESLKEVVILSSCEYIGNFAFYNCSSLTSIIIPNTITSIGYYAFSGCSSLKKVYYYGPISKWESIYGNSYLSSQTKYFYSEIEPEPETEGKFWHYVNEKIVEW